MSLVDQSSLGKSYQELVLLGPLEEALLFLFERYIETLLGEY